MDCRYDRKERRWEEVGGGVVVSAVMRVLEYGGLSGKAGHLDPIPPPLLPPLYPTSIFTWDVRNNLLHKPI